MTTTQKANALHGLNTLQVTPSKITTGYDKQQTSKLRSRLLRNEPGALASCANSRLECRRVLQTLERFMDAYFSPIAGGILIGLASMGLLATLGRVAGISGIAWGALAGPDRNWRLLFLVGLIAGSALAHTGFDKPIPAAPDAPLALAVIAGLLVGFGTRMGSGCTSGHGVCGIGRLSVRSLVATLTFMTSGLVTVFVVRHVLGGL